MARLSLSIFVLCLFLALMVSAMPVKRENSSGNELDGTLAEQVAEQSLEVIHPLSYSTPYPDSDVTIL